ncbi:MAG: UTP--glucose-1-phosphate uridylyltransferase GalU [Coxiellaceae bacterium]|nr:UTP--glucose-1-phosphate uridylyltransferase GalU [Coxiellaceae bacterium]
MSKKAIKKAIFPVAGLGTRFLPVTKASPKEMLPIVDKPLIQYAVEEAIAAGVEELIFVTSSAKRAIEDHFDRNFELEFSLKEKNKLKELEMIHDIVPSNVNIAYIRQTEALGLGHAILCAKHLIGSEPFAVLLADDLIYHPKKNCLEQMVDAFHTNNTDGVLAIQAVKHSEVDQYGIVSLDEQQNVKTIVEKPRPENTASNLAVVGRYILPANIFSTIDTNHFGAGKEIQLTDAIARLLSQQKIRGHIFEGQRYDCGSKLGYVQANIDYALRHAYLGDVLSEWLKKRLSCA